MRVVEERLEAHRRLVWGVWVGQRQKQKEPVTPLSLRTYSVDGCGAEAQVVMGEARAVFANGRRRAAMEVDRLTNALERLRVAPERATDPLRLVVCASREKAKEFVKATGSGQQISPEKACVQESWSPEEHSVREDRSSETHEQKENRSLETDYTQERRSPEKPICRNTDHRQNLTCRKPITGRS